MSRRPKLDADQAAALVAARRAGIKQAALALDFGISRESVSNYTRRILGKSPRGPRPMSAERVAAIDASYAAGLSSREVAAAHHVHADTARNVQKRRGPYSAVPRRGHDEQGVA